MSCVRVVSGKFMLRILKIFIFFLLIQEFAHAQNTGIVSYAGGSGKEIINSVFSLSDGTLLLGGQADDLNWLPLGVPVNQINYPGGYSSSSSQGFGFILHVSADMQVVLGAVRFPANTVRDVFKIKTNTLPGQTTGGIFISGSRDTTGGPDGYYIARLNRNFINGFPDNLTYYKVVVAEPRDGIGSNLQNPPPGPESSVKQMQPWDVNAAGQVLYASGHDFSSGRAGLHFMNAAGADTLVDYFSFHKPGYIGVPASGFVNGSGNPIFDLKSSHLSFAFGQSPFPGALRSNSNALFNRTSEDENGNPGRKGAFPNDAFFSGPQFPGNAVNSEGPGYTGYAYKAGGGILTARISSVLFDKRNGDFYIGYSLSAGSAFSLPGLSDSEPAVAAFGPAGNLKWWARLHKEDASGSLAQQHVEGLEIDYSRNNLVVLARSKGNAARNFWSGNELKLKPGGNGFQNRVSTQPGQTSYFNLCWIGKYSLADGKILHATFVADLAANQVYSFPSPNPDYQGYPDLNKGNPVAGDTRIHSLSVNEAGEVLIAGTAERILCTRQAYQKMYRPDPISKGGGLTGMHSFVRLYSANLDTVRYSSLLSGLWNPGDNSNGRTELRAMVPAGNGFLFAGLDAGTGNNMATLNVPSWGSSVSNSVSGIFGRLSFSPVLQVPPPPDTIFAPADLCTGTEFTFSVPPVPGASSYIWLVEAQGWTGSSVSPSITLTRNPGAASGTLSVFAVNNSGVSTARIFSLPSSGSLSAPSAHFFPDFHCLGQSKSYQVKPVTGALSYSWSLAGPGCAAAWNLAGDSTTFPSVSLLRSGISAGPCSLQVAARGCAGSSAAVQFDLSPSSDIPAVPIFSGTAVAPCAGIAKTYSVNPDNQVVSYLWNLSGTGFSGTDKGASFEITAAAGAQNGVLSVAAQNECGQSSPAILNLGNALSGNLPAAPDFISGPSSGFCNGNTQTYTVTNVPGQTYNWYSDGNLWQISPSGNSAQLSIPQNGSSDKARLFVQAVNQCGAGNPASLLIIKGRPMADNQSIIPTLAGGVCAGTTIRFQINPVPGASLYQWIFPSGWTIQGSSDGTQVLVSAPASATPGNILIRVGNACGFDTIQQPAPQVKTNIVNFSVQPSSAGSITLCAGTGGLFYVTGFGPSAGINSFEWAEIPAGVAVAAADEKAPFQDTIRLIFSEQAQAGNLKVYLQSEDNRCGQAEVSLIAGSNAAPERIIGNAILCNNPPDQVYRVNARPGAVSYEFQVQPSHAGTISVTDTTATVNWNDNFSGQAGIRARVVSACGPSPFSVPLQVNIGLPKAAAPEIISICGPGPVRLTASGFAPALNFLWYADSLSLVPLANTPSGAFNTTVSANDTFFVALSNGTCISTQRARILVNISSAPQVPAVTNASRCGPGSLSLSAVSGVAGASLLWYNSATGGTSFFSGNACTLSLTQSDTFYVANLLDNCFSGRVAVNAVIKALPPAPQVTGQSRCDSGSVVLSASGISGSTLLWYTLPAGGNPVASGPSFTTPVLSDSLTYFVLANLDGCESQRSAVLAAIASPPEPPAGQAVRRCGPGVVTLAASVPAGLIQWYAGPSGGPVLGTGSGFATPFISTLTPFYASVLSGGCESSRIRIDAIPESIPSSPLVQDAGICAPGPISLTASGAGNQLVWYADSNAVVPLFTGNPFVTNLIQNTDFYVSTATAGGCESPRVRARASIYPAPEIPQVQSGFRCGPGSVILKAAAPGTSLIRWYDLPSGGSPVFTGKEFNTTITGDSLIFYAVRVSDKGCESPRVRAIAKAVPVPQPKAIANPALILAGQSTQLSAGGAQGSYLWTPSAGLSATDIANPTATPSQTIIYKVGVILNGCAGYDSVEVQVENPENDNIPNVFTPNGDGIYDTWEIPGALSKRKNSLKIFNRWGIMVEEFSPYNNDWDGGNLPDGTYFYQYSDGTKTKTGTITIIH